MHRLRAGHGPSSLVPAMAGMEIYWQGAAIGANGLRLCNLLIDRLLF